jgi:hypothetical protein
MDHYAYDREIYLTFVVLHRRWKRLGERIILFEREIKAFLNFIKYLHPEDYFKLEYQVLDMKKYCKNIFTTMIF